MSLRVDSRVTLEDVWVRVDYFLAGCDYSFNFLVLFFVSGALSLRQIDVTFKLSIYLIDSVSLTIVNYPCLQCVLLHTFRFHQIDNPCSICRSSCYALAYMNIPSENAKMTETYLLFVLKFLVSHLSLRNMFFKHCHEQLARYDVSLSYSSLDKRDAQRNTIFSVFRNKIHVIGHLLLSYFCNIYHYSVIIHIVSRQHDGCLCTSTLFV